MATFVLVHGGYPRFYGGEPGTVGNHYGSENGGHLLKQVDLALRPLGHDVYRPTLTGFGSRLHLAGPDLSYEVHFRDIIGLITYEGLEKVILLGWSAGGLVITGVADRIPQKIGHMVYLDAMLPNSGESLGDLSPEGREWIVETDRMLPCVDDPISSGNPDAAKIPGTYIYCTERTNNQWQPTLDRSAARAKARGWEYHQINSDHGACLFPQNETYPEAFNQLVEILRRIGEKTTLTELSAR